MAAEFIMDTVAGASLQANRLSRQRVKTGIVKGIDTLGNPDHMVLDKALEVVLSSGVAGTTWGAVFPSGDPDEKGYLSQIFVFPITYNMCRIQLVYEANQFATTSSYIIRDSGYLQGWQGNVLPGTGEAISTAWEEKPNSPPPGWVPARVPADYIPMNLSTPVRTIGVTAVIFGEPPEGLADTAGYVNDGSWNGLDKGYWRVEKIESDTVGFAGYYTYTALVATRGYKDWSESGILRNKQTGRYVPVDQTEIDELMGRTYSYGVMQGGTGARAGKAGIVRVCPHPETNLTYALGF